jgi:hypothetical protein
VREFTKENFQSRDEPNVVFTKFGSKWRQKAAKTGESQCD